MFQRISPIWESQLWQIDSTLLTEIKYPLKVCVFAQILNDTHIMYGDFLDFTKFAAFLSHIRPNLLYSCWIFLKSKVQNDILKFYSCIQYQSAKLQSVRQLQPVH